MAITSNKNVDWKIASHNPMLYFAFGRRDIQDGYFLASKSFDNEVIFQCKPFVVGVCVKIAFLNISLLDMWQPSGDRSVYLVGESIA